VRITLQLHRDYATQLITLVKNGQLGAHNVISAILADPPVAERHPAPPPSSPETAHPRAVVFTHFGSLVWKYATNPQEAEEFYKEILTAHLRCGDQVGLLYVYIDSGLKAAIQTLPKGAAAHQSSFSIPAEIFTREKEFKGFLKRIEHEARRKLNMPNYHPPKIHYVGVADLLGYLDELFHVDPALLSHLCGPEQQFTYDTPKFVEAIIRLARGGAPHLARHPIIRIDEDAEPSPEALKVLLARYAEISRRESIFFFSGVYGNNSGEYDPVNDHAVRTHWFFPPGSNNKYRAQCEMFLSDLTYLGAPQFTPKHIRKMSKPLQEILKAGVRLPSRDSAQVISGAGLITSRVAIAILPPFMNFKDLTTWVDDYAKRLLHELIGDLKTTDMESVLHARIRQDRHPSGIKEEDIDYAYIKYFDRLLRGCIFLRLIKDNDGKPTEYANLIGRIVQYHQGSIEESERELLREAMTTIALKRYDEVIRCWASYEFVGTSSCKWARTRNADFRALTCDGLVDDALRYLNLLLKWPIFVRAVDRLKYIANDWLFDEIE